MEGIVGAAWRLMIQTWAHLPYGVLAGKLMFGNKHGHDGSICRKVRYAYRNGGEEMSDRMEYQVALQKDGGSSTCESAVLFATPADDAIQKAKDWARSFDSTPEDARLLVVTSGKGIATMRSGEFRRPGVFALAASTSQIKAVN